MSMDRWEEWVLLESIELLALINVWVDWVWRQIIHNTLLIDVVVWEIISHLGCILLVTLVHKNFHINFVLFTLPKLQDALITLLHCIVSHPQGGLVRVVRVYRTLQEMQPLHHHKLHGSLKLALLFLLISWDLYKRQTTLSVPPSCGLSSLIFEESFFINGIHVHLLKRIEQFLHQFSQVFILLNTHLFLLSEPGLHWE